MYHVPYFESLFQQKLQMLTEIRFFANYLIFFLFRLIRDLDEEAMEIESRHVTMWKCSVNCAFYDISSDDKTHYDTNLVWLGKDPTKEVYRILPKDLTT